MDDDELTPEQMFAAENPETMVPRALAQGRSPEDIVAELRRLDWSPEAARALVARVADDLARFRASPESRQLLAREARNQFAVGVVLVLLGASVTVVSMLAALTGLFPVIVVAYGAVLVGLVVAGQGWARWRTYRGPDLPFDPVRQDGERYG